MFDILRTSAGSVKSRPTPSSGGMDILGRREHMSLSGKQISHYDIRVTDGDVVRQDEAIGTVGNTDGNAPGISAHPHVEFRERGSGESYSDCTGAASFHGDPFDHATGRETYVSENRGAAPLGGESGLGGGVRLGSGWDGYTRSGIGDSDADGYGDLWGITGDTLYYRDNGHSGARGTRIGVGWADHTLAAD